MGPVTSQPPRQAEVAPARPRITGRAWWPWIKRLVTWGFFLLVAGLIVRQARKLDWAHVWSAMQAQPAQGIAMAIGLTAASFLVYSTFDLLSRRYTGHKVPVPRVMANAAISYAFNLNFGSLVGGAAFRYRLYSRLGLDNPTIARIISMSMLTNWVGHLFLGGLIILFWPPALPADWSIDDAQLRLIGGVLTAFTATYALACMFSPKRRFTVRGHAIDLPGTRFVAWQLGLASLNWFLMGAVIWVLLQHRIDYATVVSVLLVSAVAGVITHVPAGLGVTEAVFISFLGDRLGMGEIVAALLAYRAIYYLLPLAFAIAGHFYMEASARRAKAALRNAGKETTSVDGARRDVTTPTAPPRPSSAPARHAPAPNGTPGSASA